VLCQARESADQGGMPATATVRLHGHPAGSILTVRVSFTFCFFICSTAQGMADSQRHSLWAQTTELWLCRCSSVVQVQVLLLLQSVCHVQCCVPAVVELFCGQVVACGTMYCRTVYCIPARIQHKVLQKHRLLHNIDIYHTLVLCHV
jgi:hypothetical protein